MNTTALDLDEGEIMRAFAHVSDERGRRVEFRYVNATVPECPRQTVSVPVESHLLTHVENSALLGAVLAAQVPGTQLVQGEEHCWTLQRVDAKAA